MQSFNNAVNLLFGANVDCW